MDRDPSPTNSISNRDAPDQANKSGSAESWATITPAEMLRSVSRRLPSVLFSWIIITLIFGAVLLVWPNQYASDGLFYVRLGRGAVSIDPTTEPSRSVSLMESRSSEVKSISQMLNSREIADRVVRTVGAREINYPHNWVERLVSGASEWSMVQNDRDDPIEYDQQIAHEEAVLRVSKSVSISVPKDSYTISVSAKGSDPKLTQKVVQAIMDEYGAYHVEAHKSNGSLGFFEEQTGASETTALKARKALQMARKEMGWMSTESAEKSLRERIIELNLALDQANSNLADATSQAEMLGKHLATVEEWVPMEVTSVANAAADGMRTELLGSQLLDGERLSKVTPNHPRYKILKSKINSGVQLVESVGNDRQEQTEALNPIRINLETEYQSALAKAAGMRSRSESLQKSLVEAELDLERLSEDAIRLTQLSWAADIAEKNYLSHAQSLETSRVMNELDKQNMSDVSIIQNASLNLKKVGPPRLALLIIGSLLGLCLGALQALLRETPLPVPPPQKKEPRARVGDAPTKDGQQDGFIPRPKQKATAQGPASENWTPVPR